jgi:predicted nuclease of predicted toxin-antitoxin system
MLDIVTARDLGLEGRRDPEVLEWAATNNRIVLTPDRATMPDHASRRIVSGAPMPGVFLVSNRVPACAAIDDRLLMDGCSEQVEWAGLIIHIPL